MNIKRLIQIIEQVFSNNFYLYYFRIIISENCFLCNYFLLKYVIILNSVNKYRKHFIRPTKNIYTNKSEIELMFVYSYWRRFRSFKLRKTSEFSVNMKILEKRRRNNLRVHKEIYVRAKDFIGPTFAVKRRRLTKIFRSL